VVDNQSSDTTARIATAHGALVEYAGPERSAQRNWGARAGHGDYLLFIDSDMSLPPTVVSECLATIKKTSSPAVIISETTEGDGFLVRCRQLERSCYVGDDTIEAARFMSRDAFARAGGFDETLSGPEDWDLSNRLSGGSKLPRIDSLISHDEDGLQLATLLKKKRYYARSFVSYWRRHGHKSIARSNPVFRRAFLRNWRRFVRHPVLGTGVLFIKSLEAVAAVLGLLDVLATRSADVTQEREYSQEQKY
jgi:glycosyltransferase involved in cell wall biosynthesis